MCVRIWAYSDRNSDKMEYSSFLLLFYPLLHDDASNF